MPKAAPDTVIIGIGNYLLCDDTVGLHVAAAMKQICDPYPTIQVTENHSGGVDLLCELIGFRRCILVDAVFSRQMQPGMFRIFQLDELIVTAERRLIDSHGLNLASLLTFAKQANYNLPDLTIIGIEAIDVETFSEQPTKTVAKAIPKVVNYICADILRITNNTLHMPFHSGEIT